jgi:hypothetical protein
MKFMPQMRICLNVPKNIIEILYDKPLMDSSKIDIILRDSYFEKNSKK